MKTQITISLPFVKGMFTAFSIILVGTIIITACEDIRIGKTKAEIAREMFVTDSLIKTIHLQFDSTSMDFNRLYIDAQRINNGHF